MSTVALGAQDKRHHKLTLLNCHVTRKVVTAKFGPLCVRMTEREMENGRKGKDCREKPGLALGLARPLQGSPLRVTLLGIWKSVTVTRGLHTVSLYPDIFYCTIRKSNWEFGEVSL